jgi:hypothetical protein
MVLLPARRASRRASEAVRRRSLPVKQGLASDGTSIRVGLSSENRTFTWSSEAPSLRVQVASGPVRIVELRVQVPRASKKNLGLCDVKSLSGACDNGKCCIVVLMTTDLETERYTQTASSPAFIFAPAARHQQDICKFFFVREGFGGFGPSGNSITIYRL